MSAWLFQGNPKFYKVRPALRFFYGSGGPTTWLVNRHQNRVHAGDRVFFWEAGPQAGLVGWGTTETGPSRLPLEAEESQFVVEPAMFDGTRLRVRIRVEGACYFARGKLCENQILSKYAAVARGVQGTTFAVPEIVLRELEEIILKQ